MNRIWDHLDTMTRLKLAEQFKLKCLWIKFGKVDDLELEGPILIEENRAELSRIMRQPPQLTKAVHG